MLSDHFFLELAYLFENFFNLMFFFFDYFDKKIVESQRNFQLIFVKVLLPLFLDVFSFLRIIFKDLNVIFYGLKSSFQLIFTALWLANHFKQVPVVGLRS